MRLFSTLGAALLIAVPGLAQDANRDVARKIETMRLTVNFEEAPLSEVVEYIREAANINILIKGEVDDTIEINFKVKDISLKSFFNYALKAHDLGTIIKDGILFIVDIDEAHPKVVLHVYDVADMVRPLHDMPGREITFGDDGIQFTEVPAEVQPEMGDFLVELIRMFTGERAWEVDDTDVFYQNGLMIVRQTSEMHRKIETILSKIRRVG